MDTTYKVMIGQAGNRLIVSHKERGREFVCTSHYATLEEFFSTRDAEKIEWYRVRGREKVFLKTCHACGYVHTDGTSGNCGD